MSDTSENKSDVKSNVCKHCGSSSLVKNGTNGEGDQRYKCKTCGKTFLMGDRRIKYSLDMRRLALSLYLLGTSLRGIQKALSISISKKISFNVIENWIEGANSIMEEEKKKREENRDRDKPKQIAIVEMDELYTFVKKNREIRKVDATLIKEYGLLLIGEKVKLLHLG